MDARKKRTRATLPAVVAMVQPLERRDLKTGGLALPAGFTAGSQTTASWDSGVSYATLTNASNDKLLAFYTNSGTDIFQLGQYTSDVTAFDDPEPLPTPSPGSPTPPPPPTPVGPDLPGIAIPVPSSATVGTPYYVIGSDFNTYEVEQITDGDQTYYGYLDGNGDVYAMYLTSATS